MDAHITDKEFDKGIARNKLLHECKTKGFKRLERLGRFNGGFKKPVADTRPTPEAQSEIAMKATELINEGGLTLAEVSRQMNCSAGSITYYCNKFGIRLGEVKRKVWDHAEVCAFARRRVNRRGYRLSEVARKLGATPPLVINALKSQGYKYDAQLIKIRKVKKS